MKKNQMPLSLKETILLDGNAGLKELRSLSFEPSVSITEHADHVLIEGSLHLAGEGIASLDSRFDEQAYQSYERVQVINHVQDEQLEFEHYFPITVNVSSSRITNIHQLDVYIDHIDYELKDERVLFIQADIIVDGVSKEVPAMKVIEPMTEIQPERDPSQETTVANETGEVKREEAEELPIRLLPNPLKDWNGETHEEEQITFDLDEQMVINEEEQENTDSIEPHIAAFAVSEVPQTEVRAVHYEEEQHQHEEPMQEQANDEEERYEDTQDEPAEIADDQALMSFVTSLQEDMTTIKIYITQQNETPEMVAERYGVSMIQLMKANQFETRAPFERGQLVWIP
ncbi:hypothetical protein E2R51_01415 [Jeotgalibacillus sp. S-D1]|uniref:hypothetical protein n=1 Tax=Jeotgalibacillus sp. S-D1 TaxID=2552189 RepID=UPI0010596203|nr:hypothetical protein [Jeotgalibacillus sp. S-D1]TDL34401.1 hypothetical protein E2R51_01415 [Jeotgalibacillus sp. S-D1]